MTGWQAVAPAKLNLALHITGKREDGYHLLESLVAFADIGDGVTVSPSPELTLVVDGLFAAEAGMGGDNHVLRAARLLQAHLGETRGAHIRLEKRLPVGAGLGGGSSDAATVARLLLKLWGHILPEEALQALLLPLGADMPMCVAAVPLVARGIGEQIETLPQFPALHAVLCWPGVGLETKRVYQAYRADGRQLSLVPDGVSPERLFASLGATRNVLQQAAIACSAEVAEALLALESLPGKPFVRMSGSGACCVAYFAQAHDAETAADWLGSRYPAWWVRYARIPVR